MHNKLNKARSNASFKVTGEQCSPVTIWVEENEAKETLWSFVLEEIVVSKMLYNANNVYIIVK